LDLDILCVFGRGIEKVNEVWVPTQHIEELSDKNGHPGVRAPGIDMNDDNLRVVIAGGEFNALATALLYNRLVAEERPPVILVFAAGRPAYIADDPDPTLSEGRVLLEYFRRRAILREGTEVLIQDKNRNTRDDLMQTLFLARERGLRGIGVISVLVHLARCQEFFRKALEVKPEFESYGVRFLASETILMQEESEFTPMLSELLISAAYCRTAERERKGIADLRAGKYYFGSQGYGFASGKSALAEPAK